MTLATLQALTSFWPYAHSSHSGFIGVGGEGGTFYLHHPLCFTGRYDLRHPTGSDFILAFCSQQPFRVYWGGGRGERSTCITRFVSQVGMTFATLQALTSF